MATPLWGCLGEVQGVWRDVFEKGARKGWGELCKRR